MKLRILLPFASLVLATTGYTHAADVLWSAPQVITDASDVNTQGTLFISKAHTSGFTVNGVTFDGPTPANYLDTFGFNTAVNYPTGPADFVPAGFIGANDAEGQAYGQLLDEGFTNDPDSAVAATLTFSGLTPGSQYLLQYWAADYRTYPNDRNLTLTGGINTSAQLLYLDGNSSVSNIHGSYVIGTFIADATTQVITVNSNESTMMQAVQLREVTPSPAITGVSRNNSGEIIIDFTGAPETTYDVTKSLDLATPFAQLIPAFTVTTNIAGVGQAIVPTVTSEPKAFFRIEK